MQSRWVVVVHDSSGNVPSGGLVRLTADVSQGKAVVSFTSDPDFVVLNVKPNERLITLEGHASIVPAIVSNDGWTKTTYMPNWYVMCYCTAVVTCHLMPYLSCKRPNSEPQNCFSSAIITVPPCDSLANASCACSSVANSRLRSNP